MTKINLYPLLIAGVALFCQDVYAQNGWCGESKKEDCGNWVVQMNLFRGGSWDNNDCVSYDGCVESAQWNWSNPGAWSQLLLEKKGFCNQGYRVSNTEDFNVSYNGNFSNDYGQRRVAIVSWAKTTDDCEWRTDNLYELYLHEQSYGETDNYASWCEYLGESTTCSGSTYKMYDCGDEVIIGRVLRAWRNNPRTSGTTDVDCLWENFRSKLDDVPDVYYYFTEVGAEVGPNSGGQFNLSGQDMVRVPVGTTPPDTPPGTGLVDNGIYRLTCNWGNKNLHVTNDAPASNVTVANPDNSAWSQQWILRKESNDVYRLEARWGGMYLQATGKSNNANVYANTLNEGWSSQQWKLTSLGGNEYRLQSVWEPSMYLTGNNENGGNVTVHSLDAGWSSQKWQLTEVNTNARTAAEDEKVLATTRARLGITPQPIDLAIYPNPARHGWVEVTAPEQADLRVIDISGKEVLRTSLTSTSSKINTDRLTSGVYTVRVSSSSNTATTKLVVTD